jgi:hypothetical protein
MKFTSFDRNATNSDTRRPLGHRDHQRVSQSIAVLRGRLAQRLDLILRDVLVALRP